MAHRSSIDPLFRGGVPVGIEEVLADRDERATLERRVLERHPDKALIVATLNIPGPIKYTPGLDDLFGSGADRLMAHFLDASIYEDRRRATGCTLFALTNEDPLSAKRRAVAFEDEDALGRLFDVDVLRAGCASALSRVGLGMLPRTCLVCDCPAKECARSRRHSLEELYGAIRRIYETALGGAADARA
ncbi:holo-ACP synthase CitX [Coriobacterium glomerans PW2]|uniref:citrate lyase holo-[acyl-carrier protein] synthase n=1 Tax=Coriobacterium glomerans (strain ATCC 49209 / DSM 20642 / JCM 10262 / PW2) TaxID=700015 RepID=F2NBF6_CORGP|nr:citrate lyase holo-[acyl-carrier protein] synthase [Coriobacterium glomerans]AEB06692.1 holo-ACP synthase CitX [Coriobacterium glomerans PW2]